MDKVKDIERLIQLEEYEEKLIKFKTMDLKLNQLALFVCSKEIYNDFIFYEKENELSIGIGIQVLITVYSDKIIIKTEEKKMVIPIKYLNLELKNIFLALNLNDWRAYGISNFNFSYYTYYKENLSKAEKLMEFIIPKIDLRLSNNHIKIRAFKNEDIIKVENIIRKYKPYNLENYHYRNDSIEIKEQNSEFYKSIVSKAVSEINQDKYQKVILSRKVYLDKRIDMVKSYLVGRNNNTPARSYYLKLDDLEVIGYSPETIVEVDSEKNVYTFPLAGTRAMGKSTIENEKLKKDLLSDPKEIAEHAASVKLAFNELENVCIKDSVSVIKFMDVLERGTVQHLASRLKGKLKNDMNEWHAFSSLFPAVTASGIPKKESVEAIDRLEEEERGLYSGGIFTYDKDGELDVALVLRSAYQNSDKSWIRAGAGIVSLSKPERELEETKEKLSSVVDQLVYLNE